jgi:hypothetical protein
MSIFTAAELAQISTEIDEQLYALRQSSDAVVKSSEPEDLEIRLAKQMEAIAQSTQTLAKIALQKIHHALQWELCDETGELNKQWKKYGGLDNKDFMKRLEGVLIGTLGMSDHKLVVGGDDSGRDSDYFPSGGKDVL